MGTVQLGDFFKKLIGQPVSDFKTRIEIERAVEKKLGRKLESRYFRSTLISSGDVIPYCSIDRAAMDRTMESLLRILKRRPRCQPKLK